MKKHSTFDDDKMLGIVFVGYSSTKGYGLVDRLLYMPECWLSISYTE